MNSSSLCVKDVRNIIHELKKFQEYYTERFRTKTKNLKDQALQYLKGKFLEKDGKDSVGIKRQYLGRLGKIDNGQMGVFLGYANGNRRTLIDERLYLPEDWANDPIRRKKCGVPDDIVFKTKAQLGLEMLLEAQRARLSARKSHHRRNGFGK